jgi:signal transduction histidine kinase
MKRLLAAFLAAFTMIAASAEERGTPAEAEAMVKKAIAHYKKVGREKAMADFSNTQGAFVDRDLYVVVLQMDGLELAHINPRTVGKNMMDLRDPDGRPHIKERLDAAKKAPSGWHEYKFFNPMTKKIELKSAYWERVDDLVFACGAYKPI